jgi:tetratricopeptide (TPR) repeat protein
MIPENHWHVINELIKDEEYYHAITLLEDAYDKDPNDPLTLATMALMHCYLGDYEQSDLLLTRAIEDTIAPFEVYWIMAQIFLEAGLVDDAVRFWQNVEVNGMESGYFAEIDYDYEPNDDDLAYIKACMNDCRYMLSKVFHHLDKKHLAQRYERAYVNYLKQGISSRFDVREIPK